MWKAWSPDDAGAGIMGVMESYVTDVVEWVADELRRNGMRDHASTVKLPDGSWQSPVDTYQRRLRRVSG
jgi:hypothetical protein